MAADTPQDMSLEQQKLVRALVKALDAVAARLRRVPLDDEKQACRELTDILHAVRAIANASDTMSWRLFCMSLSSAQFWFGG
jgi:hypothetical protein